MTAYTQAAYQTLRDNGGTFTPDGYPVKYETGYMVGGFAPTKTVALPPEARWDAVAVANRLREYVVSNEAVFGPLVWAQRGQRGAFLGTWVDDGTLYIDASKHYTDKQSAIAAGIANGEVAIWDCAAGAAINLAPCRAALQGVMG